jgi:ketopantoate reductase
MSIHVPDDMRVELWKNALVNNALRHMAAIEELNYFDLIHSAEATERLNYWSDHIRKVVTGEYPA